MPNDTILAHPKTDEEILNKVNEFRRVGSGGSHDLYDRMRQAEDFVVGEQWDQAVKDAAKIANKFTLTIPIIKPQINQISGSEIQNPQDFIIENTQGGAATIARVLTALVKQVADSEQVRFEKSSWFKSGISSGQGCMGVFLDKTEDPKHSNIRIQKLNEHHVLFDPNGEGYDINRSTSGCQYVIWDEPVPKEQLEQQYPDKKEDLQAGGSTSMIGTMLGNIASIINWQLRRGNRNRDNLTFGSRKRSRQDTLEKTRYWKTHTFWKEYKTCVQWFDNRESELESKFLCRDKEITAARKATKENSEIFTTIDVDSFIMHHTITVRDTFLEDRVDEFNGVQMFPVVPYWPYEFNGYKSGVSEDLIGTQQEINWTHSMALNQVKQMSYPPVIVKEADQEILDELRTTLEGGKRAVISADRYGGEVEFAKQPDFPTVEVFTQQAMNNVKTITGRLDIPETKQKALSGKAKLIDLQKTQQGSMTIFSNYNHSLAILGNLIVDTIRKNDIFSDDEIRATVDSEDLIDDEIFNAAMGMVARLIQQQGGTLPTQPPPINPVRIRATAATGPEGVELAAQMVDKFQDETELFRQGVEQMEQMARPIAEDILIDMIHQMKVGKYNTKITMSPMAETMRKIKSFETFELQRVLRESGDVGLDGDDLIESTDVANKEQLRQGRKKLIANIQGASPDVSVSRSA
ncbi:hypothetical protein KAR91_45030 [Candidatus Pacearchaeota archaeon]|nr:hypothetical protein [Candidatus Pacearchaeota archaeon]